MGLPLLVMEFASTGNAPRPGSRAGARSFTPDGRAAGHRQRSHGAKKNPPQKGGHLQKTAGQPNQPWQIMPSSSQRPRDAAAELACPNQAYSAPAGPLDGRNRCEETKPAIGMTSSCNGTRPRKALSPSGESDVKSNAYAESLYPADHWADDQSWACNSSGRSFSADSLGAFIRRNSRGEQPNFSRNIRLKCATLL